MARIHGVDVSDYQANWQPTPEFCYVFIKTTEGKSWKSKKAAQHRARAREAGYVVGWYHFLWPSASSGSPQEQADWFIRNALAFGMKPGDLLVCDWEPTGGGTPTQRDKNAFISAVKKIRGNQNKIGLYCNQSMWDNSDKLDGDFLWLARYGPEPNRPWLFWQYTETPIDKNWGKFQNKDELRRWAGSSIPAPAPPAPKGILGMSTYIYNKPPGGQKIPRGDFVEVGINDKGHSTVTGENKTVTVTGVVRLVGLEQNDWAELRWQLVEVVKENNKDVTKFRSARVPVTVMGVPGRKQNVGTTFNGAVPKNQRLRLAVRTNAESLSLEVVEIQGWKE